MALQARLVPVRANEVAANELTRLQQLVAEREIRLAGLQHDISARDAALQETESALQSLTTQIEAESQRSSAQEKELRDLRLRLDVAEARFSQTHQALLSGQSELAKREEALDIARRDLADLKRQVAAQQESLSHAEGQRGTWETMLREREAELEAECLDLRVQTLTLRTHGGTESATSPSTELVAPEPEAETESEPHAALSLMAGADRERIAELEGHLRAAEEQVHRLESQLRVRAAPLVASTQDWATRADEPTVSDVTPVESVSHAAPRNAHHDAPDDVPDDAHDDASSVPANTAESALSETSGAVNAPGPTRFLVMINGDTEVVHRLKRRTSIGRAADNDIMIDTSVVSRTHAVIAAGPQNTYIEDLNSTNGLTVNKHRVKRQQLRDGDLIQIGASRFRFVQRR